jgi:AsmA protein
MRKIAVALGIVVGLIVLALAAILFLVDVNQYRGLVQAQLERQLSRKVTLGKFTLGLLPLRFQVDEPVIAEDPSFGSQMPFVRAEKLDVRVSLFSLLMGDVKVQSLELERPSVELIKNRQGVWNYATLGAGTAGKSTTPAERPKSAFALDRLRVRNGQVALTDLRQRQARSVYDHIDLTLLNYGAGRPFSFDLTAPVGDAAQELRLKGDAGPVSEDNPAETPFRGTFSLNKVGMDGLKKFLNSESLSKTAGFLSAESQITNQSGTLSAAGNLKLEKARFNGVDVGYPITLDYNLSEKLTDGILMINSATLHLGETPLSVTGSVNTNSTPPNLNLNVKSQDVSIAEIARLASAFGVAFAPGTTVAGRVSANLQARGPAANPALTGTISGRNLQISGKDVPQRVDVKALDLALSPSEIRSNEFDATSGKTTVTGRFALRQYTSKSPVIDVALRAPGATLPEVQSIAKAYGMTGLDQISGAGKLNLDLRAGGPLQSLSSQDLAKALNGNMDLDFNALRIAGFDAGRELATIGGFASPTPGNQNFTDVVRLIGRIVVKDGIAQTNDLQAQLAIGNLAASGTADLATEALNMKVSAILSKAFSDKVGGTRVGGYMSTALSNSAGELVIPAVLTGSFKQPKFAPDVQAFVEMQKKKAVSSLLGAFTEKKDKSPDQPTGQKPAGGIKGILGGLLDRKKPDQQKQ